MLWLLPRPFEHTASRVFLALALVWRFFLDLARRDMHHLDGRTDHVGWALLAFGAFGHTHSSGCLTLSIPHITCSGDEFNLLDEEKITYGDLG